MLRESWSRVGFGVWLFGRYGTVEWRFWLAIIKQLLYWVFLEQLLYTFIHPIPLNCLGGMLYLIALEQRSPYWVSQPKSRSILISPLVDDGAYLVLAVLMAIAKWCLSGIRNGFSWLLSENIKHIEHQIAMFHRFNFIFSFVQAPLMPIEKSMTWR